jgi:uncharacterized protein YndB with AHSA1/START domain
MTYHDNTPAGQTDRVSFEVELRHAPAKVWRALTDPALLTEWLLPALDFRLEPGAAFSFQAPPQPGWDGSVRCRFTTIEEGKQLSYTWVVGEIDTLVTFTLTPTPTGTRLSMVQTGFKPHQKQNFGGARYGWRLMGGKLIDLLATRDLRSTDSDKERV